MRNSVAFFLLIMGLAGPLAAQPVAPARLPHPDVPAAMDVAGLHLILTPEAQRLVQQKADGLCRHQPSFQARVDLADASFPIIDRILQAEGVPLDFRYLALQESALQGDARSNHEAVGYWQLKLDTATDLGLLVNNSVDERQHLAVSTRAAARYLTRSNASLHNWLDALLSYYTGLGGVKPYTLPSDYNATQMTVSEATSPYVLMFLAQKIAFEPAVGLNPKPALRLQEFPAQPGQSLAAQAQPLHVDPAALAAHNHWLLAAVVPTDKAYTLIVPVGDVTQAAGIAANQRLQSRGQLINAPAVAANTAQVTINRLRALIALPGETTADLARRAHQRLGEFLKHNEMRAFDAAIAGRPYFLEHKRDAAAVEYHVLQPGETIFDVAQKYGMRQRAVYAKNRLHHNDELRPGRVLWLQHVRPREVAPEYRSLAEAVALERPSAPPVTTNNSTDELLDRANEAVAAQRATEPEDGKVKVKIKVKTDAGKSRRVITEEADGWGEALSTATTAAATPAPRTPAPVYAPAPKAPTPAPVAAPVAKAPTPAPKPYTPQPSAAKRTYLPAPAAAPAPAPLADEPRETDSTIAAPAAVRPAPRPVPVAPAPTPAPVYRPAPAAAPVAAAPRPVAVPAPAPAAVKAAPKAPAAAPAALQTTHTVAPHESVYSVGRLYQLAPAALIAMNHLEPPYGLTVGQVLVLQEQASAAAPAAKAAPAAAPAPTRPAASTPTPTTTGHRTNPALYVPNKAAAPATNATPAAAAPAPATAAQHTVVKGETLYSISRLYGVKVADLQAWNGKAEDDESARIGEVLRVSAPAK